MVEFDKDDVEDIGLLKLDILGVRMQSTIAYTLAEIEKYATGKSGASLLFGHAIARSATIVRNVQYMINKFEMQRLSAALDDPNSIELLQQLAKEPLASRKADALYKALIGASTAENPEE
jgi:hypothetical protein